MRKSKVFQRAFAGVLTAAMVLTSGSFGDMQGSSMKAQAAENGVITLSSPKVYDVELKKQDGKWVIGNEITGSGTPNTTLEDASLSSRKVSNNGSSETAVSNIYMDVLTEVSFQIGVSDSSDDTWNAELRYADGSSVPDTGNITSTRVSNKIDGVRQKDQVEYFNGNVLLSTTDGTDLNILVGDNLVTDDVYLYVWQSGTVAVKCPLTVLNPIVDIPGDEIYEGGLILDGASDCLYKRTQLYTWLVQQKKDIHTRNHKSAHTDHVAWEIDDSTKASIKQVEKTEYVNFTALKTSGKAVLDAYTLSGIKDEATAMTNSIVAITARGLHALDPIAIDLMPSNMADTIQFNQNEGGDVDEEGNNIYYIGVGAEFDLNDKMTAKNTANTENPDMKVTDIFTWEENSSKKVIDIGEHTGKVTGKGPGTAVVTVYGEDNSVSAKCKVCVVNTAENIYLAQDDRTKDDSKIKTDLPKSLTDKTTVTKVSMRAGSTLDFLALETAKASVPNEKLELPESDDTLTFSEVSDLDGVTNIKRFSVTAGDVSEKVEKEVTIQAASENGADYTFNITIYPKVADDSQITFSHNAETLTEDVVNLYAGDKDTYKLTALISVGANEPNDQVDWKFSKNNNLLTAKTYSDSIELTPNSDVSGTTTLTATSKSNPKIKKEITINILTPATKISLNTTSLSLNVGETYNLEAITDPEDAQETILWNSGDTDSVSVDTKGKITANKVVSGYVTVTATTEHSQKKAECKVSVYETASLNLRKSTSAKEDIETLEKTYDAKQASYDNVYAVVLDTNGKTVSGAMVKWSSSDETVASVESDNSTMAKILYGEAGEATITATCGKKKASFTVTVAPKAMKAISSSGYQFTDNVKSFTYTGKEIKPEISVYDGEKFLIEGIDYTMEYQDNVNAGNNTAKAVFTGKGNYTGENTVSYTIEKKAIDDEDVIFDSIPQQNYCATKMEPKLHLSYNGIDLIEDVDYTVTFDKNSSVGTATATVTPIKDGNFTLKDSKNPLTQTFAIVQKKTFTNMADSISIEPIDGAALVDDTIYVNAKNLAQYTLKVTSTAGTCDDIVYVAGEQDEKLIEFGTTDVTDGTTATLNIVGNKAGVTKVTLQSMSGNVSRTMNVVVYQPASKLSIYATKDGSSGTDVTNGQLSIIENHTQQFEPKFDSSDCTDQVTWISADPTIAEIDANSGLMTTHKTGTVNLTATIKDTETGSNPLTASVMVTITKNVPAESITLDKTSLELEADKTATLHTTVLPNTNTEQLVWKTSDDKVATVSEKGEVKAIGAGTATITCSSFDGNVIATCTVNVITPAKAIAIDTKEKTIAIGEKLTLTASLDPSTATDVFEWTVSKEGIISINQTDKDVLASSSKVEITGLAAGKVTITAKSKGSGKTVTCSIEVLAQKTTVDGKDDNTLADGTTLAKVALKSAKNVKKKSILVKWASVAGAEKYQISYSLKKNFKKAKVKAAKKTSLKLKKLKKKKKYFIRVRACATVDGKLVSGKWSKVKAVKIKK